MSKLLYLLSLRLMFAAAIFAQNDATPAANDQAATVTTDQAAPVDPQAAVPDAQNGKDPYGRPVQPIGTGQAQVPPLVAPEQKQQFSANVKDVLFDFNRYDLRSDAQSVLQQDAEWLKAIRMWSSRLPAKPILAGISFITSISPTSVRWQLAMRWWSWEFPRTRSSSRKDGASYTRSVVKTTKPAGSRTAAPIWKHGLSMPGH
jgi:hypothetical protein